MSYEPAEFENEELLRMVGDVRTPEPSVLEHARGVLWSVIASEMLGVGPAGERQRRARRPQTGQTGGERRMSMGGGGDPER
jgi:hypothetical protein